MPDLLFDTTVTIALESDLQLAYGKLTDRDDDAFTFISNLNDKYGTHLDYSYRKSQCADYDKLYNALTVMLTPFAGYMTVSESYDNDGSYDVIVRMLHSAAGDLGYKPADNLDITSYNISGYCNTGIPGYLGDVPYYLQWWLPTTLRTLCTRIPACKPLLDEINRLILLDD